LVECTLQLQIKFLIIFHVVAS